MRLYSRLQIAIALTFAVTFAGVPSHVRSETRPLQISQAITQADLLFWQSIKDSKDPAMYRAYLKKFPKGVFAELAKLKVQKLSPGLPAPQKQVAQPSSKTNSEPKTAKDEKSGKMILVLDASGSMRAHLKGRSKMAVARDVFKDVVKDLDPSLYIGLTAYGHRRKDDCSDIEHLLPAQKLNPKSMISTVNRLKPIGKTPLTESVRQAAKNLKYTKQPATIILISDGRENCGADPCAVAKELKKAGAKFTVHVIGFDIKKEERRKLQCIADNTGGKYFAATDAGALKAALRASVAETKTAFEQGTAIFPTLGETDEYPRLAFQWKISKAVEGSDKAGNVVYTTKGSDRLINPKLPSGRYVVEISYANAKGRKVINYEAKSGKQYHIPLIAGRLTAWVIKKAGGDAYKGPPYPNWNISRAGSKKVAFSDINDRTTMILAPGTYGLGVEVSGLKVTVPVPIKTGQSDSMAVLLATGRVVITAISTKDGSRYKGPPYPIWQVHAIGTDGKVSGKSVKTEISNQGNFVLAPGKYRISTKAGVLRAKTEVNVVANKKVNTTLLLASGQVLLRSYFTKGGVQHTSSPYNNWTIHPIGKDGKPSQKALSTDISVVGDFRVSPGRYLVRVKAGAMRGATEVNVAAGKIVKTNVDLKAAKIRISWDNKAITQWRVYPLDANKKPAARYVTYAYENSATVNLPAGQYLVRGSGRGIKSEGSLTVTAGQHESVNFGNAK